MRIARHAREVRHERPPAFLLRTLPSDPHAVRIHGHRWRRAGPCRRRDGMERDRDRRPCARRPEPRRHDPRACHGPPGRPRRAQCDRSALRTVPLRPAVRARRSPRGRGGRGHARRSHRGTGGVRHPRAAGQGERADGRRLCGRAHEDPGRPSKAGRDWRGAGGGHGHADSSEGRRGHRAGAVHAGDTTRDSGARTRTRCPPIRPSPTQLWPLGTGRRCSRSGDR